MSIQFGGLASGLDTSAIISALLAIQRRPIFTLEGRKTTEQTRLSLFGTFEGLVDALQKKAQELVQSNGFYAYTLQEGNEGVAAFTLSDGAVAGSHELIVAQLAQADRYTLNTAAPVTDPDMIGLGEGTITFDYYDPDLGVATSYTVTVAAGSDSLNGIAAAINADAGDAVTASVINTGTGATPQYELVIAGDDTGADFAIQNLTVGIAGLISQTNLTTAKNAQVTIDGLAVERSSNVFSDVLAGVSFTVSSVGTTTFTIDADPEGMKENVRSLVDAYNAVIEFINTQNTYAEETGAGGELFGDGALRSVGSTIHSALFNIDISKVTGNNAYATLGLIGVDLNADGTLTIDETQFDEKLAAGIDELANLFLDTTDADGNGVGDGLLLVLDDALDNLLKSSSVPDPNDPDNPIAIPGLFERRRDTINEVISGIDDEIERIEYHLEQLEASLVQRFSNLETLLAGLNAQASFLSSSLAFPQQ